MIACRTDIGADFQPPGLCQFRFRHFFKIVKHIRFQTNRSVLAGSAEPKASALEPAQTFRYKRTGLALAYEEFESASFTNRQHEQSEDQLRHQAQQVRHGIVRAETNSQGQTNYRIHRAAYP